MQGPPGHSRPSRNGQNDSHLELRDGSRVGVIGGGPAGSFFSYFLMDMAERVGKDISIDIYEPRDFSGLGPVACNMCGGIISESLVQNLAAEGINLPATVVQRGIDSYVLHTDVGSARIDTPLQEKRIGAVHRAAGPRNLKEAKWNSFDGYLQSLATKKGATLVPQRVEELKWENGRPEIKPKEGPSVQYDLLVVATGVNSTKPQLFENLDLDYGPPETTKTFIREFYIGADAIKQYLSSSMHVFLLDLPGLEFAAIIPKGDYASICLLGDGLDKNMLQTFLETQEVRSCMPPDWDPAKCDCQCSPRISIRGATHAYGDRIVFIGDSGVTRLYKDGIGAGYRTAKAAASTAIFQGISATNFERHYWPVCRAIESDNTIGKAMFAVTGQIQKRRFARQAILRMVKSEQKKEGRLRGMSTVLWDLFTGSTSYKEILMRTLRPSFVFHLARHMASFSKPTTDKPKV